MRVLDRSVYRGPHPFGRLPMIRFALDLEDLAGTPTDELPGFPDALVAALPGLHRHGCSRGRPGGFVERMHEGTWMGHVVEHVALELQSLAGHPLSRGKTRAQKHHPGVFDVLYAYESPTVALAAGRLSLELVGRILGVSPTGLDRLASALPLPNSHASTPSVRRLAASSTRLGGAASPLSDSTT
jgi:cyanophycin synthetase